MKKIILITMISISLFSCKKYEPTVPDCSCGTITSLVVNNNTPTIKVYKFGVTRDCDSIVVYKYISVQNPNYNISPVSVGERYCN